MVYPRYLQKIF
uniref:Uncharacterized protein n=1 Tax=Rhizophora mucronata TaxID=61149 RepID=A0A2P2P350_RHIMU